MITILVLGIFCAIAGIARSAATEQWDLLAVNLVSLFALGMASGRYLSRHRDDCSD